jgi:hypothetical protein
MLKAGKLIRKVEMMLKYRRKVMMKEAVREMCSTIAENEAKVKVACNYELMCCEWYL